MINNIKIQSKILKLNTFNNRVQVDYSDTVKALLLKTVFTPPPIETVSLSDTIKEIKILTSLLTEN